VKTINHREWYRNLGNNPFPVAFRHAPAWVFERMRPPTPRPATCGWLSGTIAPGISDPVKGIDGEILPEVFSDAAWRSIMEQSRAKGRPIKLLFRHGGARLASAPGDLTLRHHERYGVAFEARLADTHFNRFILGLASGEGLGVSIGYSAGRFRYERRGVLPRVRVIESCRIDHVAVLSGLDGYRAAYPAARCYGVIEAKTGFTHEARAKAYRFAELAIGRQAAPLPPAGIALASRCPRSASRR
jgi:hypothetical protein